MAKILLVNPQIITSSFKARFLNTDDITIRHSLAFLSSSLKQNGHKVSLVDFRQIRDWGEYEQIVKYEKPEFLGVTMHTCEFSAALEACKRAKKIDRKIITITGGIHPTIFPEECKKYDFVDFVIRGEGEVSLSKLLDYSKRFEPIFWGETPDLDSLPFEDRELWHDYKKRIQYNIVNFIIATPVVDILCQRGCPWQCKFCCGPGEQNLYTIDRNGKRVFKFRARSVENVMQEIKELYNKYHFKSIIFHDDQFIVNPKWTKNLCDAMISFGFPKKDIKWWAAVRADVICRFKDIIKKMRMAGVDTISVGFESFSDRMLKWMKKGTTSEQNFESVKILRELGIKIHGNFIFGMPYSDGKHYIDDDIITLKAIKEIQPETISFSYFTPIPGSPFYEWFNKNGLIIPLDLESLGLRFPTHSKVKGVDYESLNKIIEEYIYSKRSLFDSFKDILRRFGFYPTLRKYYRNFKQFLRK